MLKFFDNQNVEHFFKLENLVHVHVRRSDEKNVTLGIHTLGPHTVPVTVDPKTAEYVLSEIQKEAV
ncbi:hypothetical protein [Acinetobacter sp. NigerLNRRAM0016]